ncbi:tail fiber protein [Flavobacterium sp. MC2016-06]|jgi:hypothetical protein|uniref:tail fiber protein n=1 Tax=Flavobacterium sp. MC2016-06 TaxID=2676308 RepID=UPI0012BAF7E5|nr:tail fiber protein [Flavobacterium sp. MC2016-06]MBU3858463.1 hypothetical protein [Flavobacterium sp. MC2016-06]
MKINILLGALLISSFCIGQNTFPATGNVGIGTVNPLSALEIRGYITTFGGPNSTDSYFNWGVGNGSWDNRPNDANAKPFIIQHHSGLTFNAHSFYGGIRFYNQGYPSIYDSALVMSIVNEKVGIGTSSPDERLTVKGKIHTQEVRVDMNGPLVPDYVFAEDYKLKTLKEVEDYVKENSHLPEIPSAKEIDKNGLMLAEMNMALLKKIEELTLYAIEQQKNTEKLKEIILEQNKRLEILENNKKGKR